MFGEVLVRPAPVLPKLEHGKEDDNASEGPMPEAQVASVNVAEDKW